MPTVKAGFTPMKCMENIKFHFVGGRSKPSPNAPDACTFAYRRCSGSRSRGVYDVPCVSLGCALWCRRGHGRAWCLCSPSVEWCTCVTLPQPPCSARTSCARISPSPLRLPTRVGSSSCPGTGRCGCLSLLPVPPAFPSAIDRCPFWNCCRNSCSCRLATYFAVCDPSYGSMRSCVRIVCYSCLDSMCTLRGDTGLKTILLVFWPNLIKLHSVVRLFVLILNILSAFKKVN